jgi:signal recognition particle subunit SRP54
MFGTLGEKISGAMRKLGGRGKVQESDLDEALKTIRYALLEADVNFKVTKELCDNIRAKALGQEILKTLSPEQQIIQIVHEELKSLMGSNAAELDLRHSPPVCLLIVGLQGSGKTTTCAKLARYMKLELGRKPLLVPADVYRPAAIDQLKVLGKQIDVEVYPSTTDQDPAVLCQQARDYAEKRGFDAVIFDTAGRLQIDAALMDELREITGVTSPAEILLVADAMTGQESVNVAQGFDQALALTGLILTKLDGDARGGAALSMKAVTGKPIKFVGMGEKIDALEVFHPDRLASRILGMGDVLSLIEKASKEVSIDDAENLRKKMAKNEFSLEDFLGQMKMIKKMGSISSLMGMIPGLGKMAKSIDANAAEGEMRRIEAIILSMTKKERSAPGIVDGSRRRRIAKGSGTSVQQVNQLLKQFGEMKKMMKKMSAMGPGGLAGLMGGGMPGGLSGLFKR